MPWGWCRRTSSGECPFFTGWLAYSHVAHTTKADIGRGTIGRIGSAGGHPVAVAVGLVTKVRPALHHLGGAFSRSHGILARGGHVILRMEPITTPLPRISRDGIESESIRRKGVDRRR